MADILAEAQSTKDGFVGCAGCGREMERPYMQLDHITPRKDGGENHIMNRILLCGPCNRRKAAKFTLSGLQNENRKVKWMKDVHQATLFQEKAQSEARRIRAQGHAAEDAQSRLL